MTAFGDIGPTDTAEPDDDQYSHIYDLPKNSAPSSQQNTPTETETLCDEQFLLHLAIYSKPSRQTLILQYCLDVQGLSIETPL